VYVDGLVVGSDGTGATRLYTASDFNQFTDIVVGQANDVQLPVATTQNIGVWNIVHADTKYEAVDVQKLTGESNSNMTISLAD